MVWRIAMITGLHTSDNTDRNVSDEDFYTVHSINSKATPLNQGPRPQISQSDTLLLKQISDPSKL
jgi:hypothetical protein